MSELPGGWQDKVLGDAVSLARGISYRSSELTENGGGRPLINLRNVDKGGGFRVYGLKYYTGDFKEQQVLQPGDLLFANTDLSKAKDVLGSPIVIPIGFDQQGAVFSLDLTKVTVSEEVAIKDFVSYFLMAPQARQYMKAHGSGTTVMHLQVKAVPKMPLPLPPLPEQEQIVAILGGQLSRLDAALASVRAVREKAAQFRRSLLQAAFTGALTGHDVGDGEVPEKWEGTSLGSLGTWTTGSTPSSKISGAFGDQCPFVTPGDVARWSKLGPVARGLSQVGMERLRLVQPPSVLVTCIGTIGKIAWTDQLIATNQQVNSLSVNDAITSAKFVSLALASPSMQELLWATSSSTTIPIVNKKTLMALPFLVPPLPEQEQIVAILEEQLSRLDAALAVADTIERRSAALRRSLLHTAFTGKLTERWRQHAHV